MAAQGKGNGRHSKNLQHSHDAERGAAVVDFVLIGALLTLLFLAIVQLTLVLHVRNTLIDAAASGARYGTLADRNDGDARSFAVEQPCSSGVLREAALAVLLLIDLPARARGRR